MKKLIYLVLFTVVYSNPSFSQILQHTQGELLLQVAREEDLKSIISKISSLRRSHTLETATSLSPQQTHFSLRFDFSKYNENEVLEKVRSHPKTIAAQFNHFVAFRSKTPNDTLYKSQWQWANNGVNGKTKGVDTKASFVWHNATGGHTKQSKEIVIAVIEDGTEFNHPDLINTSWINKKEVANNKIDDDANGYIDDYLGWNVLSSNDSIEGGEHGVSVNGLIGARGDNTTGVAGANWNIKILNLKYNVKLGIKESEVISGYAYILQQRKIYNDTRGEKGAYIVASNSSWGIDNGRAADAPLWCGMYDAMGKVGILNVSAVDNRISINIDSLGDLPSLCPSNFLIPITSIDSEGKRKGSFGPLNIDLAAPGENVFTTRPNGKYGFDKGTSFAAPIVTGAIGLLYANRCGQLDDLAFSDPAAAALLVKKAILSTAEVTPDLKGMVASGGYLNLLQAMNFLQKSCMACASRAAESRIYIDSLVLDGLRFRSRDNFGYGGFTNVDTLMPTINLDGQILLKVFPRAKDSLTQYDLRIWIDRNLDNDFDDTAELVWQNGTRRLTGNLVSNIYLPPTKIDSFGKTTIRISLKAPINIADTSKPNPCDFFNAGEVEDYTINLLSKSFDCPDVLELESAMITENSAKIFYQRIIPKLFYMIRYREASKQKWDTLPTRDSMVSLPMLMPCTDYIVESKTICDSDTSRFKNMLQFRTTGCKPVAAKDYAVAFDQVNVYPNPFFERFNIKFDIRASVARVSVRLVNMQGVVILDRNLGRLVPGHHELNLQAPSVIPSGIYFIQLTSAEGYITKKVMKVR